MRLSRADDGMGGRVFRAIVRILAATPVVFLAVLAPEYTWLLPEPALRRPIAMVLIAFAAAYVIARVVAIRAPLSLARRARMAWLIGRVDAIADAALSGGLSMVIATACLAFLATWLPHYVLWPCDRDADTFATLAQSWDAGILPYRDIRGYNFPGSIYLHWILGKVFGWGRTWSFYAFDAACLVLLGWTLVLWSRRALGRAFPGLASYMVFLTFYLSRDYQLVAGRDWHTSFCIAMGLMALEAWPGRSARIVSALLAAAALSLRPHALLFLPALISAVQEGAGHPEPQSESKRITTLRRVAVWSLMMSIFTAGAFSPLILAGIADDLVKGLRVAVYGGPYSRTDMATASRALIEPLFQPRVPLTIASLVVLVAATRGAARRRGLTWMLALCAALAYPAVHPVQHRYLALPLDLIASISIAPSIAWIVDRAGVPSVFRVIIASMLIAEASLGLPLYCNLGATVEAVATLAHGRTLPIHAPPGAYGWFTLRFGRTYPWEDYRNTLIYLRATTPPGTMVANVLNDPPFPAINGPAGRLSPFLAESGICWMWLVPIDLEPEFASALERATDALVVWSPERHDLSQMRLHKLSTVIRRHYRPEARFGRIEVWRRADEGR